jgi:nucleotide-binding universal stress UspA family protein
MKRFKHILATTDLSPESLSAVSYAGHLAKAEGARLTVLHVPHATSLVYTEFVPPIDMASIDLAVEEAARDELEDWCRKRLRGIRKVEVMLRRGVTHETICEVAKLTGASVIVMATHGRHGFGRIVVGSVTERVLRQAPCPVLVVKPPKLKHGRTGPRPVKMRRRRTVTVI